MVTHTSKGDVVSGYTRAQWPALCAEVAKLRVSTLDGEILPLATVLATAELRAEKRWQKVVTPMGLEPWRRVTTRRMKTATSHDLA
ncbi:MAG TPA: hypothetical protein VF516_00690 [Kofleriaceae bacterium]